jgi:glycosyltransferase 2 family protein
MKKTAIFALKLILTLVVLYYVAEQVWSNWDQIRDFDWSFNYGYMLLSIVCAMVALLVFSAAWVRVISAFGHDLSQPAGFRILNLSNLGRYVPGKIWQVFGMLYWAKQKGIPEEQATASFVIYQLFTIPSSLLVWVIAALFEPQLLIDKFKIMGPGSAYTAGAIGLIGCAVLVFYPQPFLRAANALLRKLGRPTAEFSLDKSVALQAFIGYSAGWILFGLAFWLFLVSVLGDKAPSLVLAIGLYNIAYQIGYLALFAPGGLGPRELIMGALLTPFVGPIAPALAIVARLWSVVIDALAALVALVIGK